MHGSAGQETWGEGIRRVYSGDEPVIPLGQGLTLSGSQRERLVPPRLSGRRVGSISASCLGGALHTRASTFDVTTRVRGGKVPRLSFKALPTRLVDFAPLRLSRQRDGADLPSRQVCSRRCGDRVNRCAKEEEEKQGQGQDLAGSHFPPSSRKGTGRSARAKAHQQEWDLSPPLPRSSSRAPLTSLLA